MALNSELKSTTSPIYTTSEYVATDEANDTNRNEDQYSKTETSVLPKGATKEELPDGSIKNVTPPQAPRAAISNYHLIRVKTIANDNYPLTDEQMAVQSELFKNVTARDLISNPRGASIYKAEDFLFCKQYGIIPNNRMITLRRFRYPVADDIFNTNIQLEPDVARMIAFTDNETNKVSEILTFSFGLRWKELKSEFMKADYIGDQFGVDGFAKNVLAYIDPGYGQEKLAGRNRLEYDPTVDSNKTFGPVDSIDSMQIRDVGLNFDHTIKLTFEYDMKSINGMNQKAVFLDILGNVLLMATNEGDFWGGQRFFVGHKRSKYADNLRFLEPKSFDDFLSGASVQLKSAISHFTGPGGMSNAIDTLKSIATNALNIQFGKFLDKVGRPAIPSMRSLLTGDSTGEHHITIGNPMNPIACIGDLIIKNTTITFGEMLGIDDFPTTLKVEIELQHNKPRDRGAIENMFNAGKGRLYLKPASLFKNTGNVPVKKSTKQEPQLVANLINTGVSALFGDFDKAAVLRNDLVLWKQNLSK